MKRQQPDKMTKNIRKGGRTGKTNANPPEENITYSKLSGFHEQDTSTYKNMEKKKEKVGDVMLCEIVPKYNVFHHGMRRDHLMHRDHCLNRSPSKMV